MDTASPVGYYGKLPCKGDFLQHCVPHEFVDNWDAWLQECLHVSRQQLEERWRDAYLTSAIWRFALAESVCGSGAYAGVMVPSVDRVGRYFPLTVVTQLHSEDCLLDIACDVPDRDGTRRLEPIRRPRASRAGSARWHRRPARRAARSRPCPQ